MKPLPFWQVLHSKFLSTLGACLSPIDRNLISTLLHVGRLGITARIFLMLTLNKSYEMTSSSRIGLIYCLFENSYHSNNSIWPNTIYIIIYYNYYGWRIQPPTNTNSCSDTNYIFDFIVLFQPWHAPNCFKMLEQEKAYAFSRCINFQSYLRE